MIDWPKSLVDTIARRRSVLFLGAGISANSCNATGEHPPTWETLLKMLVTDPQLTLGDSVPTIQRLINEKDYLTACEIIVNILGESQFGEFLADQFRRPGFEPSEIHRVIFSLDSRIIITSNIDKIYEQCAMSESHSTVVAKSYYDDDIAKYLRASDYLIIRAHGHVDDTSKIVMTHKQYTEARCHYASFYKLIDSLILTHTFVFLGCGINDPDIKLTLENSNFMYPHCPPHYFVAAKDEYEKDIETVLLRNRNIEFINFDNSDGTFSNLTKGLQRLRASVDTAREIIMEQQTW